MKLLRVGEKNKEKPAILDRNGIIRDLSNHINDLDPANLNFVTFEKIKQIDLSILDELPNNSRIGSCITKPGKFIAIGLNFSDHAAETGAKPPSEPIIFMKATSSISGPNDNIEIPNYSKKLDWEVELGLVIGKDAKNIRENNSQDYILGYCLVNDISEREWQKERGGQWIKGKSGDTFGPLGPYLVTKDEIEDPFNLNLSLDLNGKRRQTGNTSLMMFNFNFLISHISQFITLMPGDVITTGTPAGVGMGMSPPDYLKDGDEMILRVDNLGEQKLKVTKEK